LNFINNDLKSCKNISFHWRTLSLITRVNQEIFRIYTYLYLFSDLIKWQFALSNNVEIEIDLFTVFAFPSSIMDLWYPLVLKSTHSQQVAHVNSTKNVKVALSAKIENICLTHKNYQIWLMPFNQIAQEIQISIYSKYFLVHPCN
jgi:hypothetical protein